MSSQPPEGQPRITPYLMYSDIPAAVDWLERAFGFETKVRIEDGAGHIVHCELEYGSGAVGLGGPTEAARSPDQIAGTYTSSLYVFVDDIDAHYERAKAAGARIVRELENMEYGDRTYGCTDLEGHLWYFGYRYDQAAWDRSLEQHGVPRPASDEREGA